MSAKGAFSKSIEANPDSVKPLYLRMLIFQQETEYEKALEDCTKIIELDPRA